jgi:hypothetical protein
LRDKKGGVALRLIEPLCCFALEFSVEDVHHKVELLWFPFAAVRVEHSYQMETSREEVFFSSRRVRKYVI